MSDTTARVRVSRTVLDWLSGTHVGQMPHDLERHGYGWEGEHLIEKVDEAPRTRKDGSITVDLLPQEALVLAALAATMRETNLDEFETQGEARAASALLAQLAKIGVTPPPLGGGFGIDPNPYSIDTTLGGDMTYYLTGETIPGYGEVEMMTSTGYRLVGGAFVPFVRLAPPMPAEPLVSLDGWCPPDGAA